MRLRTHQMKRLQEFFDGLTPEQVGAFLPTLFGFWTPCVRDSDMHSSFLQITWNAWVGINRVGSLAADKRAYSWAQFSHLFEGPSVQAFYMAESDSPARQKWGSGAHASIAIHLLSLWGTRRVHPPLAGGYPYVGSTGWGRWFQRVPAVTYAYSVSSSCGKFTVPCSSIWGPLCLILQSMPCIQLLLVVGSCWCSFYEWSCSSLPHGSRRYHPSFQVCSSLPGWQQSPWDGDH